MQAQFELFLSVLNAYWVQVLSIFPKLLAVIAMLFVGWGVALLARFAVKKFLKLVNFDSYTGKSGLEHYFKNDQFDVSLSGIISQVVYWLVILLFVITGANILGLTELANMLHGLANFLPRIILAIVILIFGTILSRFINHLVFVWLHSLKFDGALIVSTSAEYLVQFFAIFVALEQLGVGTQLLTALFVIILGAIFLALAIAFGLGGQEWAQEILKKIKNK
jgi:hypothetical protein